MPLKPTDKEPYGGQTGKPPERKIGSTSEELAVINQTLIAATENNNKEQEKDKGKKRILFGLEIGVAIGVGVYTLITAGLFIVSLIQIGKSTDQISVMQDTEHRQLRAYVGVIPGDVENFGIPDETRFKIIRKNYGMTPAYDVGFSIVGYEITDINQLTIGGSSGVQGCAKKPGTELITMFPGTELPWTVNVKGNPFTADQIDNVRNDKLVFSFYGNVCYNDAWERPHFTDYCWTYKGTDMSGKIADGCLIHNSSN
jgi:hypothetical protein